MQPVFLEILIASCGFTAACFRSTVALNEVEIEVDEDGLAELTLSVAQGQSGKHEIAAFFRTKKL